MSDKPQVYVPVGRFVSGSLTEKRTTNSRRQPIPEDKQQFEFGVAVRKDSPGINDFWGQLINGAKACYAHNPAVHPVIDAWTQNGFNGFSMKVSDGDKPSLTTQQVNPNTVGCWVVWFSTNFIKCANNQNIQIDPAEIKRGYYVDCTATLAPNNNAIGDGVGIFMNPGLVRLIGIGEEIVTGPSIEQLAASMPTAPQLPPGAQDPSMAPQPQTPPPSGYGQPPAYGAPAGQPPAYGQPPAGQPPAGQPPAYGQPPAGQPPAYGQPPAGQPAAGGSMPPGVPPAAGTVATPPGVPVGTPPVAPAGQPYGTASHGNPQQPYYGAMTPPGA